MTAGDRSSRPGPRHSNAGTATFAGQGEQGSVASASYAGTAANVPAARRFVREALVGSPRIHDLELIAGELAANAIEHTPSGQQGGIFTVRVTSRPKGARIGITDLGSSCACSTPRGSSLSECGRGLMIVSTLADEVGHYLTTDQRHCAWAEVYWLLVRNE